MSKLALDNCRIIDGTGRDPIERGTVLINGAFIEDVAAVAAAVLPDDCERVDVRGNTVMPGLIDGHMHVTSMPGLLDYRGHIRQNLQAVGKLQDCLKWGTTTVANAGGCPENVILRKVIEEGRIRGCSRLLVGAMVNPTGGHVRGRAADGPWEVRKAVREMILAEADFIKTAASGGFQWEHEEISQEDYSLEELRALAEEAHARHKRVHVHAHAQPGLNHAIEAGCDVILHGALIDEPALEGIAAKGLYYMPTLYITSRPVWTDPDRPAHMKERMERAHPIHRAGVSKAHKMGIKIATGTDGVPGSLMNELCELVDCGLSPLNAIVAATRTTAEAFGLLDEIGTLEPGKKADVLVVQGDPTADIAILTQRSNIMMVLRDGKVEAADQIGVRVARKLALARPGAAACGHDEHAVAGGRDHA